MTDRGGFQVPCLAFIVADTKAQVALAGCGAFTSKAESITVCWLCGRNRRDCLAAFGTGTCPLLERSTWSGMLLQSIPPSRRPPDFGLHGVHRNVHAGLEGLCRPCARTMAGVGGAAVSGYNIFWTQSVCKRTQQLLPKWLPKVIARRAKVFA